MRGDSYDESASPLLRKGFYIVEEFFVGLPFFLKIYFG